MEEIISKTAPSKIPEFKKVCFRLGIMMMIIFLSRGAENVILLLTRSLFSGLEGNISYILKTVLSFIFLYIIPLVCAILLLKPKGMCSTIYRKPEYFSRAMGMFPAMYALALMTNLLTMLTSQLFQKTDLYRSFNTVNDLKPDSMMNALVLLFQLVVIAPIFEEFWFRGVVLEALRPYGNGFAILLSGLLFGLTHANFNQFFYASMLGICLGYIAVCTKSIVTTTIIHACFNSISGILLLFMSFDEVGDYLMAKPASTDAEKTPVVVMFLVFCFMTIMLMLVGFFMAIAKLRKLKRYKVPKVWTELSTGRRWGVFFSRATVIIALILAADTFTLQMIPKSLAKIFT